MSSDKDHAAGLAAALAAYGLWGVAPLFFKLLGHVGADEIIAHRVVWSVGFIIVVLAIRQRKHLLNHLRVSPRTLLALAISGSLVAANWLIFVHAVNTDRVLATSLGYFINPLTSVLLGLIFLRERLGLLQSIAVLIAVAATVYLTIAMGSLPWIALGLALTFSFYSLVRKLLDVGPMVGLFWETLLVSPIAVGWFLWLSHQQRLVFAADSLATDGLLIATGLVTVAPLVLFAYAVRRLALSTIGVLQYLAPSLTFLMAVFLFREPFSTDQAIAFSGIWLALILFTYAGWRRRPRPPL